ncbi:cytochrome P450 89A2-like [Alnus glutinosa]|uniref:cytochrome P450 89A2-like n=1 Tax=Alnus glutinosa TaxID=3517 RepID=UPI002D76D5C0|nr:cytochrome P450 89A2-like [Alnus glutinosa]
METWFLILISLCISVLLNRLILAKKTQQLPLPPGPFIIPILGRFQWLRRSFSELEPIIRNLHATHGPIITLHIGSRPAIFVANRGLAHKALVQNGAVFADRPPALPISKIISSNQHNISSASYGSTWRILRRNLTSEILHPSRVKSYSRARKWVLDILMSRLISHSTTESGNVNPVVLIDHFQYAMFCLLVLMCFGDKLSEAQIKEIEVAQRHMLLSFRRFNILNIWPTLGKIIFRKRWDDFWTLRRSQDAVLMPLIEARKRVKQERVSKAKEDVDTDDEFVVSYVDTLLDLELPEEKRKLDDGEMISLCSEFLNAGTDTTSTALQWIMANLVKYPHVQERVLAEIKGVVVGDGEKEVKEVKEEDLHKLPYLKAVVLEGLRRHPPGHFVLPHAVTEDVVLDGYLVPKNANLNFMVADMGWDPKVWEDPLAFKPERFLRGGESGDGGGGEVFDVTGNREIKMMPFGAGRRICPASGLAMLHLEYFVANLVWNFDWKAVDGDEIDLSEKQEFTMVMKYPLKAHLSPRF